MIRYSLICDNAHEFDSWFANSGAFDEQSEQDLVVCPFCDSAHVTKAIMSPRVARTDRAMPALPMPEASAAEVAKPAEEKKEDGKAAKTKG